MGSYIHVGLNILGNRESVSYDVQLLSQRTQHFVLACKSNKSNKYYTRVVPKRWQDFRFYSFTTLVFKGPVQQRIRL